MLLALLLSLCYASRALKMVQVSGTVVGEPSGTLGNFATCLEDCWASPTCFLAYSNANGECISLTKSSPYQVELTNDGRFVGFKVDAEACPETYQTADYTVTMADGYTYQWTRNDTSWSFSGARKDWTYFKRADGTSICMKTFTASQISFDESKTRCAGENAKLAGVASVEESQWVQNQLVSPELWHGFWIGGVRNCPAGPPCTTYDWIDGLTTSTDALVESNAFISDGSADNENCLTVAKTTSAATINDVNCELSTSLIMGYVCAYQPQS